MKKIPVKGTKFEILVDAEDYETANAIEWRLKKKEKWTDGKDTYAPVKKINGKEVFLRRLIMPEKPGYGIRHTNGDQLDCRKENLEYRKLKETDEKNSTIKPVGGRSTLGEELSRVEADIVNFREYVEQTTKDLAREQRLLKGLEEEDRPSLIKLIGIVGEDAEFVCQVTDEGDTIPREEWEKRVIARARGEDGTSPGPEPDKDGEAEPF